MDPPSCWGYWGALKTLGKRIVKNKIESWHKAEVPFAETGQVYGRDKDGGGLDCGSSWQQKSLKGHENIKEPLDLRKGYRLTGRFTVKPMNLKPWALSLLSPLPRSCWGTWQCVHMDAHGSFT